MTRAGLAAAMLALLLAGCGEGKQSSLGTEPSPTPSNTLAQACGHPGARVDYRTSDCR